MNNANLGRRHFLRYLGGLSALTALPALAHHTETHFEDDSEHHVVFQCNKAEPEYIAHILFAAGEMIRKYGDDVEVVISCFGPGIHLLAKKPQRPVSGEHRQRAASLASYGVAFHACGNTLKSLKWTEKDLVSYAKLVPIGSVDLMLLQEKGFTYISW